MRIGLIVLSTLFVAGGTANGQKSTDLSFTFKGVPLGISEAAFLEKMPGFHCENADGISADRVCRTDLDLCTKRDSFSKMRCREATDDARRYAGINADRVRATFYEDRLARIQIVVPQRNYPELRAALISAFGKPARRQIEIFRLRGTPELVDETLIWSKLLTELALQHYATGALESSVLIYNSESSSEFSRREKAQAKGK
jgi:hypothetical protein